MEVATNASGGEFFCVALPRRANVHSTTVPRAKTTDIAHAFRLKVFDRYLYRLVVRLLNTSPLLLIVVYTFVALQPLWSFLSLLHELAYRFPWYIPLLLLSTVSQTTS